MASVVQYDDGERDCSPYIYNGCATGETRSSEDGEWCYGSSSWETTCTDHCKGIGRDPLKKGFYDSSLGVCVCKWETKDGFPAYNGVPASEEITASSAENLEIDYDNCRNIEETPPAVTCSSSRTDLSDLALGDFSKDPTLEVCNLDGEDRRTWTMRGVKGVYNLPCAEIRGKDAVADAGRRSDAPGVPSKDTEVVVVNPLVCVHVHDTVIFSVTNSTYPVFAPDNLLNSQESSEKPFDIGPFAEVHTIFSQDDAPEQFAFAYVFRSPGTWVMHSINDKSETAVFRVKEVDANGGCGEHRDTPFLLANPSRFTELGIQQNSDLTFAPDMEYIIGALGLGVVILMCASVIMLQCRGWDKSASNAAYRRNAERTLSHGKTDLHKFSSKQHGMRVEQVLDAGSDAAVSGEDRKGKTRGGDDDEVPPRYASTDDLATVDGADGAAKQDAFFDGTRLVDLDGFVFSKMQKKIDDMKDVLADMINKRGSKARELHEHVDDQNIELKAMLSSTSGDSVKKWWSTDPETYAKRLQETIDERTRRAALACDFAKVCARQVAVHFGAVTSINKHHSGLLHRTRQFEEASKGLLKAMRAAPAGTSPREKFEGFMATVPDLLQIVRQAWVYECERSGNSWMHSQFQRMDANGDYAEPVRGPALRYGLHLKDAEQPTTAWLGLRIPGRSAVCVDVDGVEHEVPADHFIHQETGMVLPIAGNVSFDVSANMLVVTVDSTAVRSEIGALIPFIPAPSQGDLALAALPEKTTMAVGALFREPWFGQIVPLVAATYNDAQQNFVPVGGTHISPFTGTRVPIEIGDLMLDAEDRPCAVLSVGFNSKNCVVPLGGFPSDRPDECHVDGEFCVEPLSGLPAAVSGLRSLGDSQAPVVTTGAPQVLLHSMYLQEEGIYLESLEELSAWIQHKLADRDGAAQVWPEELEAKLLNVLQIREDTNAANKKLLEVIYSKWLAASRTRGQWTELETTGGVIGKINFGARRQLPVLIGVNLMHSASQQEVPVLGVTKMGKQEETFPLGGVMLDPKTSDIVPITIAAKFKEMRATGDEESSVNSAVVDTVTDKVMPSAQVGFNFKPDPVDYYLSKGIVSNYATLTKDFSNRVELTVGKIMSKFVGIEQTPADKVPKVSTEARKMLAQLSADRDAFLARKAELAMAAGTFPEYVRTLINDEDEWTAKTEQLRLAIKKVTKGISIGVYNKETAAAQEAIAKVYEASTDLMESVSLANIGVVASNAHLAQELARHQASTQQAARPRGMHELLERLATTLQGITSASDATARDESGPSRAPGGSKLGQGSKQGAASTSSLRVPGSGTEGDGAVSGNDTDAEAPPVDKEELERKALERAKIEGVLLQSEAKKIREVKDEVEAKRKEAMKDATQNMIETTMAASSAEEKAAAFAKYQEAVAHVQLDSEQALNENLEILTSGLAEVRSEALADLEMEGDEDVSQIKDRMLQDALGNPDDIIKAGSAAERRRQIQETRARLEATSKRNAKLRNRLGKKLKALETEEQADQGTSTVETELEAVLSSESKTEIVQDVMEDLQEHIASGAIRLAKDANLVEALAETNSAIEEKTAGMTNTAKEIQKVIKAQLSESQTSEDAASASHGAEMDAMVEEQLALISSFVQTFNEKTVHEETAKAFEKVVVAEDIVKKDAVVKHAVSKKKKIAEAEKKKQTLEESIKQQLADEAKANEQAKHVVNENRSVDASEDTHVVAAVDKIQAEVEKKVAAKMAKLEKQHLDSQVELRLAQEKKLQEMQDELAADLAHAEKQALADLEEEHARKVALELAAQQEENEFNMSAIADQANSMSAEELVRENARRTHEIETQQRLEKQKNSKAIKDKLAAAKERKLAKLKLAQEMELAEVASSQKQAKADIVNEETLKVEAQVLKDAKKAGSAKDGEGDKMIFAVLQHRHKEEQAVLELQNEKDLALAITKALADAEDQLGEDRARLTAAHKAELDMEKAEGKTRHARTEKKHAAEMEELEERGDANKVAAERQAKMAVQLAHSNAKLALRQKQYEEIASTFKKLSPDAEMVAQYEEAAVAAKKNAAEFKDKVLKQQEAHIAAVKEKGNASTAEKRAAVQAQIEAVEAELEKERMRDKTAQDKKKAEREARQIFLSVQAATNGNQSQEQRDKLLEQHTRDQEAIARATAKQKDGHDDALQAKLAARRAAKVRRRLADLRKEDANLGAAAREEMMAQELALQEQQRQLDEFEQKARGRVMRPGTAARGRRAGRTRGGANTSSALAGAMGGADADGENAMPIADLEHILQKVADLERIVGEKKEVYETNLDSKWQKKTGPASTIDSKSLSDSEFVILQFVQFIFKLVGRPEEVHVSELLPVSDRQGESAFANSYCWTKGKPVFFRRARLTNVGECLSVAIHAAAYVSAGGKVISDTEPDFVAELHRCVALVYADLFAASLKD
jgi:hypothetical protein